MTLHGNGAQLEEKEILGSRRMKMEHNEHIVATVSHRDGNVLSFVVKHTLSRDGFRNPILLFFFSLL